MNVALRNSNQISNRLKIDVTRLEERGSFELRLTLSEKSNTASFGAETLHSMVKHHCRFPRLGRSLPPKFRTSPPTS